MFDFLAACHTSLQLASAGNVDIVKLAPYPLGGRGRKAPRPRIGGPGNAMRFVAISFGNA
jgi:hypothetical protein